MHFLLCGMFRREMIIYFGTERIGASFRIKPTALSSECTSPPANCHLIMNWKGGKLAFLVG